MTAATEIEVTVSESTTPQGVEGVACNLCNKESEPVHLFPIGTQDPETKVTAVIITCRTCWVGNISLELRRAIYELWNV